MSAPSAPFHPRRRQVDAYTAHRRSIFYPKADEAARKLRHEVIEREEGGEKVVYRYSTLKGSDLSMWVETAVAERAGATVPVTTCRRFDRTLGVHEDAKGTYQICWPAAGVPLATVIDPYVRQCAYVSLGRSLSRLHGLTVGNGAGFVYPTAARMDGDRLCGVHPLWSDHLRACLVAHVTELFGHERAEVIDPILELAAIEHTLPRSLLHADLSDHNLFVDSSTGGITAFLDWEDALIGDPLYDLADWATFHDGEEDLWHFCFDAYFGGKQRPWDFERRFWAYFLRISLCKWVQHRRYETPDTTRSQKRVERALEMLG